MNDRLRRRIANAVICSAIILLVSAIFLSVIPEFKKLFAGSELPNGILLVIEASDYFGKYWYFVLPPLFLWLAAYVVVPIFFHKSTSD